MQREEGDRDCGHEACLLKGKKIIETKRKRDVKERTSLGWGGTGKFRGKWFANKGLYKLG